MHLNAIDQLFPNCQNTFVLTVILVNVPILTSMSMKEQRSSVSNKKSFTIDRNIIYMLGLVLKLGCVSDGSYLALYLISGSANCNGQSEAETLTHSYLV
jgi:hypothetical protein